MLLRLLSLGSLLLLSVSNSFAQMPTPANPNPIMGGPARYIGAEYGILPGMAFGPPSAPAAREELAAVTLNARIGELQVRTDRLIQLEQERREILSRLDAAKIQRQAAFADAASILGGFGEESPSIQTLRNKISSAADIDRSQRGQLEADVFKANAARELERELRSRLQQRTADIQEAREAVEDAEGKVAAVETPQRKIEHKPLIMIKTKVIEVERNNGLFASSALDYVARASSVPSLTSGLPLNSNGASPALGFENSSGQSRFPIPGVITGLTGDVGAGILVNLTSEHINWVASFLGTELNADTVTAPQVTTLHGEQVEFIAGAEIPFEIGFNTIQQNANNVQQFVYSHVGTLIRVTPRIVGLDAMGEVAFGRCKWDRSKFMDCMIDLDILVQLSDADFATVDDQTIKGNIRNISNKVQVANGHGVVMGGLISARDVEIVSKTPVLGDVPGLGFLFRSKTTERTKTETLIFVEAHVLEGPSYAMGHTLNDFNLGGVHAEGELNCSPLIRGAHSAGLKETYAPQPNGHDHEAKVTKAMNRHQKRHRIATQIRDLFK